MVDDHPAIVSFIARSLSAEGYSVESASDGPTGLAKALASSYDVVLLDLSLPAMEGEEVLSQLREARPALPVVVISASAGSAARRRCLELGAIFLIKPFTISELLQALGRSPAAPMM